MIRAARLERNMIAQELSEKASVSRPLPSNVKKGRSGGIFGAAFEIAVIVKVQLFVAYDKRLNMRLTAERRANGLLRHRAFEASRRLFAATGGGGRPDHSDRSRGYC